MSTSISTHGADEMIVGPSERHWVDGRPFFIRRAEIKAAGKIVAEHRVFSDSELTIESDDRIADLEAAIKAIFDAAYTEEAARMRGGEIERLLERIGDIARTALEDAS